MAPAGPAFPVLPNAGKAIIDLRKFTEYAMNFDDPVGRPKARVFESALGFTIAIADKLLIQIIADDCRRDDKSGHAR